MKTWADSQDIEKSTLNFYNSLTENGKRMFAGLEAMKLGFNGVSEVSKKFNIHKHTIRKGQKELLSGDILPIGQIRAVGGGMKKKIDTVPGIDEIFATLLTEHTAGDPMDTDKKWTNLTVPKMVELLRDKSIGVCVGVVKQLLKKQGFCRRKMVKNRTMKVVENRDAQFKHIEQIKSMYMKAGFPVLSIDTKKKEMLGNFYRDGKLYTRSQTCVNDHDFKSFSTGSVIPHGIYDLKYNKCYLTIGKSKDTATFLCDNIEYVWNNSLKHLYHGKRKIVLLFDGGGSNSCLHHVVKEQLQILADKLQIEIVVAHYPPYCSKWNPIEHKAFCHITKAWSGVVLDNYEIVKELAESSTTKTGFSVEVNFNNNEYETGKKASKEFLESKPFFSDGKIPKLNYWFIPRLL